MGEDGREQRDSGQEVEVFHNVRGPPPTDKPIVSFQYFVFSLRKLLKSCSPVP